MTRRNSGHCPPNWHESSTVNNLQWTVGDVTVTRVEEVVAYIDAWLLMPDFTADMITPHREWLVPDFFAENNKMALSIHTFVVSTPTKTIVVDTCVGGDERPLPNDPEFPDRLDASIEGGLAGVDLVLCTHLHFDHVGWNLREVDGEQVPTFPNARYLLGRVELEHTRADDHMGVMEPSVQPLLDAGLVDLVETDHMLTDEVRLVATPGHTPGHVSVAIESQNASALITGDMAHTPLQFATPELASAAFDSDSAMSTATRRAIIAEYADTPTLMLGTHFAPPTAGRIVGVGTTVTFDTKT